MIDSAVRASQQGAAKRRRQVRWQWCHRVDFMFRYFGSQYLGFVYVCAACFPGVMFGLECHRVVGPGRGHARVARRNSEFCKLSVACVSNLWAFAPKLALHVHHTCQVLQQRVARGMLLRGFDAGQPLHIGAGVARDQAGLQRLHQAQLRAVRQLGRLGQPLFPSGQEPLTRSVARAAQLQQALRCLHGQFSAGMFGAAQARPGVLQLVNVMGLLSKLVAAAHEAVPGADRKACA